MPLRQIPGGQGRRLQIAAHDGFHSVYREVALFDLAPWPPSATILLPREREPVPSRTGTTLRGEGFSAQDGSLPDEALRWRSDRDGELGFGKRVRAAPLSPGRHRITLTVTDHAGLTAAVVAGVTVVEDEQRD